LKTVNQCCNRYTQISRRFVGVGLSEHAGVLPFVRECLANIFIAENEADAHKKNQPEYPSVPCAGNRSRAYYASQHGLLFTAHQSNCMGYNASEKSAF
jgi:hypothetical protein